MTADPYRASAGAGDPGSWNRYAYVRRDPTNFRDSRGLLASSADQIAIDACLATFTWDFCVGVFDPSLPMPMTSGGNGPPPTILNLWDVSDLQEDFVRLPHDDLSRRDLLTVVGNNWAAAALIAGHARQGLERQGLVMPKYLEVTRDCYTRSVFGNYVITNIDYRLYGTDGKEMAGAIITEHLFGDLPGSGSSMPGLAGGRFQDQQSVGYRVLLQRFTATGVSGQTPPFFNAPVFVRGFGRDNAFLSIEVTNDWVSINGDRGLNADGSLRMYN